MPNTAETPDISINGYLAGEEAAPILSLVTPPTVGKTSSRTTRFWWSRYCPTPPPPTTEGPNLPITDSSIRCWNMCSSSRSGPLSTSSAAPLKGARSCIR